MAKKTSKTPKMPCSFCGKEVPIAKPYPRGRRVHKCPHRNQCIGGTALGKFCAECKANRDQLQMQAIRAQDKWSQNIALQAKKGIDDA